MPGALDSTQALDATQPLYSTHANSSASTNSSAYSTHSASDLESNTVPVRRGDKRCVRTTVVLDVRECVYSEEGDGRAPEWFELALDATTSVALAAARTSFPVHLRTTASGSSPAPAGNWSNVGEVLDWLALVQPAREGSLVAALAEAGRGRDCGELVVVTGTRLTDRDREQLWASAENFDETLLIQAGPNQPELPELTGLTGLPTGDKVRTLWARDTESLVLGWVRLVSG